MFQSLMRNKPLLLSCLLLVVIFVLGQWLQSSLVFNREAITQGAWWRLLSGHFTHSNWAHLLLNVSGVLMLPLLFMDTLRAKLLLSSVLFLALVVGLGLYFLSPELDFYYGFSGVLYGLYFVAGANTMLLQRDFLTGAAVAGTIAAKVLWDIISGGGQASAELIGVTVATQAHTYGVAGALLISAYLLLQTRLKQGNWHPPTF